ncbi:MAG: hypothetical protein KatS3mg034_1157 [Vicingaceae bacterium]|nr:MAG: hypothetical protein KatS3mg034_1157 [Vicingaceae bacterium]
MKTYHLLILTLIIFTTSILSSCKKKEGCTDPSATNYDPDAKRDDGSCIYPSSSPGTSNPSDPYILGDITSNTVLTAKNIKVCDKINVSAGLTIPAGATITFCADADIRITSTGYINAVGTSSEPIIFKGEAETPGFWRGLAIFSNNPNNVLNFVTVKDAGSYWYYEYAGLYVGQNASLSISNSTISNHQNTGLYFDDNSQISNFSNNKFANNDIPISVPANQAGKLDIASDYNQNSSNANGFIEVRNGTVNTVQTWKKTNIPFLCAGNITVSSNLTIDAGATVMFEANAQFRINTTGSITAIGTSTNPITLKGRYSTVAFWGGIEIASNNPNNKFKYVNVSDGGQYWYFEYSNIIVKGRLELDNCTISNANSYGIYVQNTAQLFTNGSVQNTVAGVESNNTFVNNGTGPNANCTNGCKVYFEP